MAISFNFGEVGNIVAFVLIITIPIILLCVLIRKIGLKTSTVVSNKGKQLKESSTGPYLKSRFNDIVYDTSAGFDNDKYNELGFFKTKRGFQSTSTLKINDGLIIYDVKIEYHETDEPTTHVFNGFLSETRLKKSSNCYILIKDRRLIESVIHPQRKSDFVTGNKDFDKKYSIKTDNINFAKRFLTPALQELLLEKSGHLKFDVVILNDFLYVSNEHVSFIDYNIFKENVDEDILDNIGDEIESLISVSNNLKEIIEKSL